MCKSVILSASCDIVRQKTMVIKQQLETKINQLGAHKENLADKTGRSIYQYPEPQDEAEREMQQKQRESLIRNTQDVVGILENEINQLD